MESAVQNEKTHLVRRPPPYFIQETVWTPMIPQHRKTNLWNFYVVVPTIKMITATILRQSMEALTTMEVWQLPLDRIVCLRDLILVAVQETEIMKTGIAPYRLIWQRRRANYLHQRRQGGSISPWQRWQQIPVRLEVSLHVSIIEFSVA